MTAIGNRWPNDKRNIFIEHRATLLCVRALCQIRIAIPEPDQGAPTALVAAPQDEPYLLPSLIVSLILHVCGYDETNLGSNTPIDVLTDSMDDEQPKIVWLAVTNLVRSCHQNREIDRLAEVVAAYGGAFLIGGKIANSYDGKFAERCETTTDLNRRAVSLAAV
jgi:hypothetical protein